MKYMLGFRPLTTIGNDGLVWYKASNVSITKGQALFQDASGYLVNTSTAFDKAFIGVAAASVDNSGGSAGDLYVPVIPPRQGYRFIVQNESATQAAQADVGEIVDLESNDGIDVTDEDAVYWGFMIEEIDVSTEALAADGVAVTGGGFCIGRFVPTANET